MLARRAEAFLRLFGILAILGLGVETGVACAAPVSATDTPDELPPLGKLELLKELELAAMGGSESGGLGLEVAAEVRLTPELPGDWRLLSAPGEGHQGSLLEVSLSWKDFVGTSPSSFGRTEKTFRAFGDDVVMSGSHPLSRVFRFEVPLPETRILARRVELVARLHPVDIQGDALRRGGTRIDFPPATLETFRREPSAPIETLITAAEPADPEELFLAAVQVSRSLREARIGLLVDQLGAVRGEQREALFGALQFLTGTTQGRSVARWQEWWDLQQSR